MNYSELEQKAIQNYQFHDNDELKNAWIEGYQTRLLEGGEFSTSQVRELLRKIFIVKDQTGINLLDALAQLDEELTKNK